MWIFGIWKSNKKKDFIIAGTSKKYVKFEVFVKNNGRKILNRVPVMWTMLRQPLDEVILQEEAGFGNVYPNRRYTTTLEFTHRVSGYAYIYFVKIGKTKTKLGKGNYRFIFEVDPRNELGEPEWARVNNKCEVTFSIR